MAKKYMVVVVGDAHINDADYLEKTTYIKKSDVDTLKKITKILNNYFNNGIFWPDHIFIKKTPKDIYKDELTEEEIDFMDDLCPTSERGIHKIQSVRLLIVDDDIKLL